MDTGMYFGSRSHARPRALSLSARDLVSPVLLFSLDNHTHTHTHTNTNTHTGETCRYLARAVSSTCRFVYSISLPLFSLSLSLSHTPLRLSLFLSFPVFSFCVFLSFYACCSFSLSSLARSFSLSLSPSPSLPPSSL